MCREKVYNIDRKSSNDIELGICSKTKVAMNCDVSMTRVQSGLIEK